MGLEVCCEREDSEELESRWDSDPSDNKIETIKLKFSNIV